MWWTLQIAKVIHAPTNALAGKQFQDVASAWAELQKSVGERGGGHRYLEEPITLCRVSLARALL